MVAVELRIKSFHEKPVPELRPFLEDCWVGKGRVEGRHVILCGDCHLVYGVVGTGMFHLDHNVGVDKVGANHVGAEWSVGFLETHIHTYIHTYIN